MSIGYRWRYRNGRKVRVHFRCSRRLQPNPQETIFRSVLSVLDESPPPSVIHLTVSVCAQFHCVCIRRIQNFRNIFRAVFVVYQQTTTGPLHLRLLHIHIAPIAIAIKSLWTDQLDDLFPSSVNVPARFGIIPAFEELIMFFVKHECVVFDFDHSQCGPCCTSLYAVVLDCHTVVEITESIVGNMDLVCHSCDFLVFS